MTWISVKDRLPDFEENEKVLASKNVLAFDGENMFVACRWKYKQSKNFSPKEEYFKSTIYNCCNSEIGDITHWMPLPQPPKK